MISDAYVTIECNKCGYMEEFQLTATARGGYDSRDLDRWLKREGWKGTEADNDHLCPDCVDKEKQDGNQDTTASA